MKPMVIAVAGLAGVGKDTFAEGLLQSGFRRIALADNLKAMCQLVFGVSPWHTDTQEGKAATLTPPVVITETEMWRIVGYMAITHPGIWNLADQVTDPVRAHLPKTIETTRELLQFVGTEICRELINSYHVDIVVRKIKREAEVKGWVITDCRFGNERHSFREQAGAEVVLIKRPGFAAKSNHASENSLGDENEYDTVVDNDQTIETLHQKGRAYALSLLED